MEIKHPVFLFHPWCYPCGPNFTVEGARPENPRQRNLNAVMGLAGIRLPLNQALLMDGSD